MQRNLTKARQVFFCELGTCLLLEQLDGVFEPVLPASIEWQQDAQVYIARGNAKNDAVLVRIGKARGKTAAQVCLRWLTQQQIAVIPRTSRIERLLENFSIFDFELSNAEMAEIGSLAHPDGRLIDYAYSGTPTWD